MTRYIDAAEVERLAEIFRRLEYSKSTIAGHPRLCVVDRDVMNDMSAAVRSLIATHRSSTMKPYTKLDAELQALPDNAAEFCAVLVHKTDTIFAAIEVKGGVLNHADAKKAVGTLTHCGQEGWRLPELHELEAIRDLTRCGPAVDTIFFPFVKSDWYWTDTKFAGGPGCSWLVTFGTGSSRWGFHCNRTHALAVRSARQS